MTKAKQLVNRLLEADEADKFDPQAQLSKVDFTKRARSFRIVDHGIMFTDYFSGHGTSFTEWESCATGYGDDAYAALDDALTQLAEDGWDLSQIDPEIEADKAGWNKDEVYKFSVEKWVKDNVSEEEQEQGDFETPSYILSVDVSQKGEGYDPVTAQPT